MESKKERIAVLLHNEPDFAEILKEMIEDERVLDKRALLNDALKEASGESRND